LDEDGVHESGSPLRYFEHDSPTRRGNSFLSVDGELNFVVLCLDFVVVMTIVVQFSQDPHSFLVLIFFNQVSRRLWQEEETGDEDDTRNGLEPEGEPPREGGSVRDFRGSIPHPSRDDEADANHLLGNTDDETFEL
jgi:hypothetical protein